jgi:hypothetical protein
MKLRILLAAASLLLTMTTLTHAEPVSLGFALWSTIGAVLPSVSFATFVGIATTAAGRIFVTKGKGK